MATAAERWIEEQERLAKPAKVYWCDGSDGEAWRLLEIGMNEERLNGPVFQPLDHKNWPTAYLHRSSPTDVARVAFKDCHFALLVAGPMFRIKTRGSELARIIAEEVDRHLAELRGDDR